MPYALTVSHVLLLAIFIPAAFFKLAGHSYMRRQFKKFRYPYGLAYAAGAVEAVAVMLLVAGFFDRWLGGLGALLLVPVMIGAAYINFMKKPPAFGVGILVILGIAGHTAYQYLAA